MIIRVLKWIYLFFPPQSNFLSFQTGFAALKVKQENQSRRRGTERAASSFFHPDFCAADAQLSKTKKLFLVKRPFALCSQPPAKTESKRMCCQRGGEWPMLPSLPFEKWQCPVWHHDGPISRTERKQKNETENRMFEASEQKNQQMDFFSQSLRFLLENTAEWTWINMNTKYF